MMSKKSDQQLFDSLKSAPTELSRSQLTVIIASLPLMPVQPIWTKLFSFKFLTMNSIIITAIVSATLWIYQPKPAQIFTSSDEPTSIYIPQAPLSAEEAEHPHSYSSTPNPIIAPPLDVLPTTQIDTPPPPVSPPIIAPEPVPAPEPVVPVLAVPASRATPVMPSRKPMPAPTAPSKVDKPVLIKPVMEKPSIPEPNTLVMADASVSDMNFNFDDLKRLKRDLRRKLVKDNLIPSRQSKILLEFQENQIRVNQQRLANGLYEKYRALLLGYAIEPSPNKQIRISPKSIMLGESTKNGFVGMGQGDNMKMLFEGDYNLFEE